MLSTMNYGVEVVQALVEGNNVSDFSKVECWLTLQCHLGNHTKETHANLYNIIIIHEQEITKLIIITVDPEIIIACFIVTANAKLPTM